MKQFLLIAFLFFCGSAAFAAGRPDLIGQPQLVYGSAWGFSSGEEEIPEENMVSGVTAREVINVASDTDLLESIIISQLAGSDVKVKTRSELADYLVERHSPDIGDYVAGGKKFIAPYLRKPVSLAGRLPGSSRAAGLMRSIVRKTGAIRSVGADERRKVTGDMRQVYARQIPKAPKMTGNVADWDYMTFKWFFNLRENPSFYPADSPQSIDIANSYSVQELKKEYFATGVMPDSWAFTGPGSATGRYGEVEWFIGSYSVEDFQLKDGIATFKVRNCSCWHSGTRLPRSWTNEIERLTSRRITVIASEPPSGKKLHKQIIHRFPAAGRIPGFGFIMYRLPTFGKDWEQVYEIRMEWKP